MLSYSDIASRFYFGSVCKSLLVSINKNTFFIKCCLLFVNFVVILNDHEIVQFFLLISLTIVSIVFLISIINLLKEFTYYLVSNLNFIKFVFFCFFYYFIFVLFFLCLFFLVFQYNLDTFFVDLLLIRLSFFEKTIICYLIFVTAIFFSDSVKDKNKFSLNNFSKRFLEFLSPIFFILFLLSFAFLTFNSNFFYLYFIALFLFFPELNSFYKDSWTYQIKNSSFVWHILRFSSGIPFLFFDYFLASDIVLAGTVISKPAGLHTTVKPSIVVKATTFSSETRRYFIFKDKSLINSAMNFINFTLGMPSDFSSTDFQKLKAAGLFSNSELNNPAGAEIAHAVGLKKLSYLENKVLFFSDFFFLNENLYVLHPKLTFSQSIDDIVVKFNSRKNNFAIIINSNNIWYLISSVNNNLTYYPMKNNNSLNLLVNQEALWTDLSESHGKFLTSALLIKTHDLFVLSSDDKAEFAIQLKSSFDKNNLKNFGESTNAIKLSTLEKDNLELTLHKNLQQDTIIGSVNLQKNFISARDTASLIDEREYYQNKLLKNRNAQIILKAEAAQTLVDDFAKINNLENK